MTPQQATEILKSIPFENFAKYFYFKEDHCCPIGWLLKQGCEINNEEELNKIGISNDAMIANLSELLQHKLEYITGLNYYELLFLQTKNDKDHENLLDYINELYDKYHPKEPQPIGI